MSNKSCTICGFDKATHKGRSNGSCDQYTTADGPRVRFPDYERNEEAATGRKSFQGYDPNQDSIWVEIPDAKWTAAYRVVVKGGEFVVGELRLYPTELPLWESGHLKPGKWSGDPGSVPAGGLSARYATAGYKFGDWRRETPRLLDGVSSKIGADGLAEIFTSRGIPPEALEQLRNEPKRRRRGDEHEYARIAALYVQALKEGHGNPVARVAKAEEIQRDKVRDLLNEARRRGLLTRPAQEGVAGGELTEQALKILRFTKGES